MNRRQYENQNSQPNRPLINTDLTSNDTFLHEGDTGGNGTPKYEQNIFKNRKQYATQANTPARVPITKHKRLKSSENMHMNVN